MNSSNTYIVVPIILLAISFFAWRWSRDFRATRRINLAISLREAREYLAALQDKFAMILGSDNIPQTDRRWRMTEVKVNTLQQKACQIKAEEILVELGKYEKYPSSRVRVVPGTKDPHKNEKVLKVRTLMSKNQAWKTKGVLPTIKS